MASPENLNKIDQFVKNSVKNYETDFDASHWDEFEKTLNNKPRGSVFSNWKYSLNTIIGIVAVGAVVSTIWYVAANSTSADKQITTPVINNNKQEQQTINKQEIKVEQTTVTNNSKVETTNTTDAVTNNTTNNLQPVKSTTIVTNNNYKSSVNNKVVSYTPQIKGITPVYGDMIDPKTGIVKPTKDDPALNQKAVDKLLNNDLGLYTKNEKGEYVINKDSLQKIFELIDKKNSDSLHVKTPEQSNIPK